MFDDENSSNEFHSLWHPLFGPIRDYPLAVCDSRTVLDSDLVESDFIYPNLESETYAVLYNPSHRWYFMKDQCSDDLLMITNFDSKTNTRRFQLGAREHSNRRHLLTSDSGVPHAGFQLPDDPTVTRQRESLEVRVVVYGDMD